MYACPKCKSKNLRVEVTAVAELIQEEDGNMQTDIASDHDWDEESMTLCADCDHQDAARFFFLPEMGDATTDANPFGAHNIERAFACARALLRAYASGEANGGSMEWEDVDNAFEIARDALPMEYQSILAQIQSEDA